MYKNLVIYYFSGTGNAKRAAEWFADVARLQGIIVHFINIDRFTEIHFPDVEGKTLIGFFSPTHGFNLPPIMLKFICKFPNRKNTDVFILNTRAGLKLSKLFVPGLSGLAQFFPALVLLFKGYRIVGMQPMDLPSNWISIHPGVKQKVVNSIFERCERITKKFAERILSGKTKYKALLSTPFDLAVAPVAVGYYFIGRFGIAKTFVASKNCDGCELCYKQCPVGAIRMVDSRPFWTFRCESCMRCMNTCPERAIETAHGFTALVWWLILGVMVPWVAKEFYGMKFISLNSGSGLAGLIENIAGWAIGLAVVWVGYRFMHFLMKFPAFEKLIIYTSLTKYKFWRRYKAPKMPKRLDPVLENTKT